MPTLHSHTYCQAAQPTLKPKLGKECVCPNARPKRPRNQRTKKNSETITAVLQKSGFSGKLNILHRINFCCVLIVLCSEIPHERHAQKR